MAKNRIILVVTFLLSLASVYAYGEDRSYVTVNGVIVTTEDLKKGIVLKDGDVVVTGARNNDDLYYLAQPFHFWAPRGAKITVYRLSTSDWGGWTGWLVWNKDGHDANIASITAGSKPSSVKVSTDELDFATQSSHDYVTVTVSNSYEINRTDNDYYWNHYFAFKSQMGANSIMRFCTLTTRIHVARYSYTIAFDPNGGNGSVIKNQYRDSSNKLWVDNTSIQMSAIFPSTPTRPGYIFDGWYDSREGGNKISSGTTFSLTGIVNAEATKTLYAHWSPTPYTASFSTTEGTIDFSSKGYNIENGLSLPTAGGVSGRYAVWEVSESTGNWTKGEKFANGSTVPAGRYGNVYLKAVWGNEYFTVTGAFENSEHGSVSNNSQTVENGKSNTAMVFTPLSQYQISSILVNGSPWYTPDSPVDSYTYQQVIGGITAVVVKTVLRKYQLTAQVDDPDHIEITGPSPQYIEHGKPNSSIIFEANTGYNITGITINDVLMDANYPLKYYEYIGNITEDTVVKAFSGRKTYTVIINVEGLQGNDNAIFEVKKGGSVIRKVAVSATAPEAVLKNIEEGASITVSLTDWSWTYVAVGASSLTKTVNAMTTFDFKVSHSNVSRAHSEHRKDHWK